MTNTKMLKPNTTVIPYRGQLLTVMWWRRKDWKRIPKHLRPRPHRKSGRWILTAFVAAPN